MGAFDQAACNRLITVAVGGGKWLLLGVVSNLGHRQSHGNRCVFRRPASDRPHRVRRMHRIAEPHQAFDALVLIQPMPGAHGVVVQQQDLRDFVAAHAIIQ